MRVMNSGEETEKKGDSATCHHRCHVGRNPTREELLDIAAKREGTTPGEIWDEVMRIRRLPKGSKP